MSVTAVAWLPAAPLLIPQIAPGTTPVVDALRQAAGRGVERVVSSQPHQVVVLAALPPGDLAQAGTACRVYDETALVSWHGFGVGPRPAPGTQTLPWPLGIGAWLLDQAGWTGRRRLLAVTDETATVELTEDQSIGLLVIGDARTVIPATAAPDEARTRDAAIELAERALSTTNWTVEVEFTGAPYGSRYVVATWCPAGRRGAGLIGDDATEGDQVIASNGGHSVTPASQQVKP